MMSLNKCQRVAKIYPQGLEGWFWRSYVSEGFRVVQPTFSEKTACYVDNSDTVKYEKIYLRLEDKRDSTKLIFSPDLAPFKQWGWEKLKEKVGDSFLGFYSGVDNDGYYRAWCRYKDKSDTGLFHPVIDAKSRISEEDALFNLYVKAGIIPEEGVG